MAGPAPIDAAHAERRLRRALGVAVACFFLLTFHGFLNLTDGFSMFSVTRSIVEDGELTVPERALVSVEGRDGRPFSKYGLGVPVISVPFYVGGRLVAAAAGHRDLLTELFVTALMPITYGLLVASTFRLGRRLGGSVRSSVLIAVGSVFGTFLLTYGQEFFSEPLVALLLVVAAERVLVDRSLPAGAALALAVVARPQTAVVVPFFVVAAFMRRRWQPVIGMGVPLAAGVAVMLLYNYARFADALSTGYEGERFSTPFLEGARGLLVGREKSVVLFAPAIVLAIPALVRLVRRDRPAGVVTGGSLVAVFISTATWHSWQGGFSWGPRLLIPAIPLTLATVAPWLDAHPLWRKPAVLLFVAGFAVSAATLVVPTTSQLVYPDRLGADGPRIVSQYELVDDVAGNTADDECEDAAGPVDDARHCSLALWQVEVGREYGVRGWVAAWVASVLLLAGSFAGLQTSRAHFKVATRSETQAPVDAV